MVNNKAPSQWIIDVLGPEETATPSTPPKDNMQRLLDYMFSVVENKELPGERRDQMALTIARHLSRTPKPATAQTKPTKKPTPKPKLAPKPPPPGKKERAAQESAETAQGDKKWAGLLRPVGNGIKR